MGIRFLYPAEESIDFVLENGNRLAFAKMDEARARTLGRRESWLSELTIRPTGYREWKDQIAMKHRAIRARITNARLFASDRVNLNGAEVIRTEAEEKADRLLCEVVLERAPVQGKAAGRR